MKNIWHKTKADLDAEKHANDFWSRHQAELQSGEFWADRIKKLRGEPAKRLALAVENMPLPASFREAAIATRALIRNNRKQKHSSDNELALLYWLAAINSFSIPYSKVLKEPGYNVVELVPGEKLKSLPFSYKSLGYKKLELLNKTDIKWFVDQWGEPDGHTTLHKVHQGVWCEYEAKLKKKRSQFDNELTENIRALSASENNFTENIENTKGDSKVKWIVAIVLIALVFIGINIT